MGISVTGDKLEEHWSYSLPETVHPQHSKVSQPSGLVAQLAECSHGKREAVGSIRDQTILKEIETRFFPPCDSLESFQGLVGQCSLKTMPKCLQLPKLFPMSPTII